jgi:hypothetical protein
MPVTNPASGGLTKFTESETLYSGKYYNKLAINSTQTNVDAVFSPKGDGGFSLQQADGTTAGGNARGTRSVDLQTSRAAATQVASGNFSFANGYSSTASGTYSFTNGNLCTSSGMYSFTNGYNSIASGTYSFTNGANCTASGTYSSATGTLCTSSGDYSFATGYGSIASYIGSITHSSGGTLGAGASQSHKMILQALTTDSTPTVLTANLLAAGTTNQLVMKNSQSKTFIAIVNSVVSGSTTRGGSWIIKGRVSRGTNAGTTVINFSTIETLWNPDAMTIAVTADTTNGAATFTITGVTATSIRTTAVIDCSETIYA